MNLYECMDYKEFIGIKIDQNRTVRGYRSELAKAAGCQLSFLSQVVHGSVHFTPEHALGATLFWQMKPLESAYFVELVNYARAGSPELRSYLKRRLQEIVTQHQASHHEEELRPKRCPEFSRRYYSEWYHAAIHALTAVSEYQTVASIARRLSLKEEAVQTTLHFLEDSGLVQRTNDRWENSEPSIPKPTEGTLGYLNHMHWRQRALVSAANAKNSDALHFSGIFTLARSDVSKLRTMIQSFLAQSQSMAEASNSEELVAMTCDFFTV
jgi:uncharacterized protein (TIGR02147 family)